MSVAKQRAIEFIKQNGGLIRTREALNYGIHRRILYGLWDDGSVIQLSRGLFQLANRDRPPHARLAEIAKKVPNGVICLKSALAFHELTVQKPGHIWLAVERKTRKPTIDSPPVQAFYFSGEMFRRGIQIQLIMNQTVRIYNAPKTVIDCFRWQKKVGRGIAIQAARNYLKRNDDNPSELMRYAKICRIEKMIKIYLEILCS
jgi:predicted transcriptional regulator of viral defense system